MDMSSVVGSNTRGFAVTDEGRIFLAFVNDPDPNGERKHGLYELKATPGSPIASLTVVDGTVTTFDSHKAVPDGTVLGKRGSPVVTIKCRYRNNPVIRRPWSTQFRVFVSDGSE